MGLTSKTSLLNLDKVGPWGPAIRIKHGGNTDEVLGAWGPRYFVGGTGNLVYVKTAANTWSEVNNIYLKTAADTWSAVRQFCVKEGASTWDGTGDDMPGSDLVFPVFQSAATNTNGTKVILTYNKTLSATTAATSAFAVVVDGSSSTVSSVATSGATVELTMQSGIQPSETVTVAYTDPSGADDANAIQDSTGLDAVSLSATSVTNNAAAPVFQSAATSSDGTKVILTYNQALSSTTAATSAFAVVVNSSAATINAAARGSDTSTIELTLSAAITEGQTVTVAYTDPSGSDDSNAIQGVGGIDVASFTATSVTVALGAEASFAWKYHMHGNTMGVMKLYWMTSDGGNNIDDGTLNELTFTADGNTGQTQLYDEQQDDETDDWKDASASLNDYSGETGRLVFFYYKTPSGFRGDAAIDNMAITIDGTTTNLYEGTDSNTSTLWWSLTSHGGSYSSVANAVSAFENGDLSWTRVVDIATNNDGGTFLKHTGTTGSSHTGPDNSPRGASQHYIYAETTNNQGMDNDANKYAFLVSNEFELV